MIFLVGLIVLFAVMAVVGWVVGSLIFIAKLIVIRRWYWPKFQKEWKWFRHGHGRAFFDALEITVERVWEDRKKALLG